MPEIDENDVQIVEDDTAIQYFVSSCLTVTCGFAGGSRIGAHFSHGDASGTFGDSVKTWEIFTEAVEGKVATNGGATWVVVRGQIDMWRPEYLTTRRLSTDAATQGDLSDTISYVTGRNPDIGTTNGSIVVLADGAVV
jgi:hypothetical protein